MNQKIDKCVKDINELIEMFNTTINGMEAYDDKLKNVKLCLLKIIKEVTN